ncbi:intraflagellar transport protein 46 homolog [Euwallacea similis]|uniref:intraflagellar transport protein 46 homolog n=1 Tax=Euwallacea similis TaxID=1736056 RepID=UPI00344ED5E9
MRRSFSIVHDDDDLLDDEPDQIEKFDLKTGFSDSDDPEPDDDIISKPSPKKRSPKVLLDRPEVALRRKSSAGPSNRAVSSIPSKTPNSSDSEFSDADRKPKKVLGEYDPAQFHDLTVDPEIAEVFEYITRYTPAKMASDYKFKPFIPEFLPAVGDIDAFLKVEPPETTLSGDIFDENVLQLGLLVLDEPASNQSDPPLLHLQLRAAHDEPMEEQEQKHIVVKKIDNLEKNSKVIDKWIKDVSHLHKSKSSPVVRYSQPMPDIDDLMQQWPEDLEQMFKEKGFPKPEPNQLVSDYVEVVCDYLQIPTSKNKIQSLHLLFCLYTATKQTQLYQVQSSLNETTTKEEAKNEKGDADQLVLD